MQSSKCQTECKSSTIYQYRISKLLGWCMITITLTERSGISNAFWGTIQVLNTQYYSASDSDKQMTFKNVANVTKTVHHLPTLSPGDL